MTLGEGKALVLNNLAYRLDRLLGRGAITDVYLATPQGLSEPVVIRLLQEGCASESPEAAAMRDEAEVLKQLNKREDPAWPELASVAARLARTRATVTRRGVIALLDAGETSEGRPFNVQELAPAPYVPDPVTNPADERRAIAVFLALVRVVDLAHRADLSLCDFDPARDKTNRVRAAWDPESGELQHLKVIDWNVTGRSSLQDRDLIYLGGHLYYGLFQRHTPFNVQQPPENLPEITPAWPRITLGSRTILQRLLSRFPSRRYQSAHELLADTLWWYDTLAITDPDELKQRIQVTRWRLDRQRAIQDLVARITTDGSASATEQLAHYPENLQQQLALLELDQGKLLLRNDRYEDAAQEFERVLLAAPGGSELARQAWAQLCAAQAITRLVAAGLGERTPEVVRARQLIIERNFADALPVLEAMLAELSGRLDLRPIERMSAPCRLSSAAMRADQLIAQLQAQLPDNLEGLAAYQAPEPASLEEVASLLRTPAALDAVLPPGDPDHGLRALIRDLRDQAEAVGGLITIYGSAAEALHEARFRRTSIPTIADGLAALDQQQSVVALIGQINAQSRWFADALRREVEQELAQAQAARDQIQSFVGNLAVLPTLLARGAYQDTYEQTARICEEMPAWAVAHAWLARIRRGIELQRQADDLRARAAAQLKASEPAAAHATILQLLALDRTPLATPGEDVDLPPDVLEPAFVLGDRARLDALGAALGRRVSADQAVQAIGAALAAGTIELAQAAAQMGQLALPEHASVPVDDLHALRYLLEQAAAIHPPKAAGSAYEEQLEAFQRAITAVQHVAASLTHLPHAATFQLAIQRQEAGLAARWEAYVRQVCDELAANDPLTSSDPALATRLYGLLKQLRATTPDLATDAITQTLTEFDQGLDQLMARARQLTEELASAEQYSHLEDDLSRLALMAGLRPGHAPLVEMWQRSVHDLAPAGADAADHGDKRAIDMIVADLERCLLGLRLLQGEVWPDLFGEHPANDTALAHLSQSAEADLNLAYAVQGLMPPRRMTSTLEALKVASDLLQVPLPPSGHWLLIHNEQLLADELVLAEMQVRDQFTLAIDELLGAPIPRAESSLDEILAEAGKLAADVSSVIRNQVEQRVTTAGAGGSLAARAAAQLHWTVVARASKLRQHEHEAFASLHALAEERLSQLAAPSALETTSGAVAEAPDPSAPPGPRDRRAPARPGWRYWLLTIIVGAIMLGLGVFLAALNPAWSQGLTVGVGPTPIVVAPVATVTPTGITALASLVPSPTATATATATPVSETQAPNQVPGLPLYREASDLPDAILLTVPFQSNLYFCPREPENGRVAVSSDPGCKDAIRQWWIPAQVNFTPNNPYPYPSP